MIKRNQPCPCGSNVKYKKCCGIIEANDPSASFTTYQHRQAGIYIKEGRHDEAVKCYQKVLANNPNCVTTLDFLGCAYIEKGDIDQALNAFQKVVALDPGNIPCHYSIANIQKYTGDEIHISEMERLFQDKDLNNEQRMLLAFGLAKAYEDSKKYERSFDYLSVGNKLKRETFSYSEEETAAAFERIKEVFNKSFVSTDLKLDVPNNNPIFILGMPRSGTSLVEQIVASHSSVYGAGELPYVRQILNHISNSSDIFETLRHIRDNCGTTAAILGNEYIKRTHQLSALAKHITDKMPINFMWLGIIHLALPNAKIIHCKRDPMDNCYSIFKNLFNGEAQPFAYNLQELGHYYLLYKDLMRHWQDVFAPETIYDISYEELVANQENETRKLLEYCELPWEDNCLSFHKSARTVNTASAVQVRKPIYKDSIHLWKRYEKHLEPLQTIISGKP